MHLPPQVRIVPLLPALLARHPKRACQHGLGPLLLLYRVVADAAHLQGWGFEVRSGEQVVEEDGG